MNIRIRFGSRDVKLYKVLVSGSVIAYLLILFGVGVVWKLGRGWIPAGGFMDTAVIWLGSAIPIMPILIFVSAYLYFTSRGYVKRLERYGYEVPRSVKEYGGILANVPRREVTVEPRTGYLSVLAVFTLVMAAAMAAVGIYIEVHFRPMIGSNADFCMVLHMVMVICWLIRGYLFRLQRDPNRYKEDVEQIPFRKRRLPLEEAVLQMILLAGITVFASRSIYSLAVYISRSR